MQDKSTSHRLSINGFEMPYIEQGVGEITRRWRFEPT
jgi:uncharacterized protein YfaP (DUF2135 family)